MFASDYLKTLDAVSTVAWYTLGQVHVAFWENQSRGALGDRQRAEDRRWARRKYRNWVKVAASLALVYFGGCLHGNWDVEYVFAIFLRPSFGRTAIDVLNQVLHEAIIHSNFVIAECIRNLAKSKWRGVLRGSVNLRKNLQGVRKNINYLLFALSINFLSNKHLLVLREHIWLHIIIVFFWDTLRPTPIHQSRSTSYWEAANAFNETGCLAILSERRAESIRLFGERFSWPAITWTDRPIASGSRHTIRN